MNLAQRFSLFALLLFCIQTVRSQENSSSLLTVDIKPVFKEQDLLPNNQKYFTGTDSVTITRLRFYLSGFKIIYSDGTSFSENNSFHLIDADSSDNSIALKTSPDKKITELSFFIGIDSATSVAGALGGDLDPMHGMYWSWNSGYINAKLEGVSNSCPSRKHEFEFHIGGYLQPHYAIRQVTIPLNENSQKNIELLADVSSWFTNVDLKSTFNVVMPGEPAMKIAENYSKMFRLSK